MTSKLSHHPSHAWDEAESLIIRLDRLARSSDPLDNVFQKIAANVLDWSQASDVGLWVNDRSQVTCLASIGQTSFMAPSSFEPSPSSADSDAKHYWQLSAARHAEGDANRWPRQVVSLNLLPDLMLQIVSVWDLVDTPALQSASERSMLDEVMHAVIEIYSMAFLRSQLASSRDQALLQSNREKEIAALYGGANLADSLHQCARAYASHRKADRVSVLRAGGGGCKLIATSANSTIDRHSTLANHLESLACSISPSEPIVRATVGQAASGSSNCQGHADRYMIESGCRAVEVENVFDTSNSAQRVGVMVTEWFDAANGEIDCEYREFVHGAVRDAIARDTFDWSSLLQHATNQLRSRKFVSMLAIACVAMFMMLFLPVTFTLPVEGRIVPTEHRRLFAPRDAIVMTILASNGESVVKGQPLFELRSPELELQKEQVRGDLLTAKTRLASLSAARSSATGASTDSTTQSLNISSGEQSLKAEISGLEKQLALMESQTSELTIASPITGVVDRWDLQQELDMRPVTQGQLLADVYNTSGAWDVELELLDQHARHLSDLPDNGLVWFYVQSQPNQAYRAVLEQIAKSAHLNARGQSVLQVKCRFEPENAHSLAMGASVWADIECGKRALGFVWFRGLVEWFERQSWY